MGCEGCKGVSRRWAGLIRGAVSVALVYYYFDPKGQSEDSHRATLIATTLVVVMFSITVFGAITKPLLDLTLRGSRGAPPSGSMLRIPGPSPASDEGHILLIVILSLRTSRFHTSLPSYIQTPNLDQVD